MEFERKKWKFYKNEMEVLKRTFTVYAEGEFDLGFESFFLSTVEDD